MTQIYAEINDSHPVLEKIEREIETIVSWLKENEMVANPCHLKKKE